MGSKCYTRIENRNLIVDQYVIVWIMRYVIIVECLPTIDIKPLAYHTFLLVFVFLIYDNSILHENREYYIEFYVE